MFRKPSDVESPAKAGKFRYAGRGVSVPVGAEDALDLGEGLHVDEADVALEVLLVGGGGDLGLSAHELDAQRLLVVGEGGEVG